jgi:hypothetical protein
MRPLHANVDCHNVYRILVLYKCMDIVWRKFNGYQEAVSALFSIVFILAENIAKYENMQTVWILKFG